MTQAAMVARRGHLPDLPAQLSRQQWRRHRRSARHHRAAGLRRRAWGRRDLALRRSSPRRCRISATTWPTTARSIRCSARSAISTRCSTRAHDARPEGADRPGAGATPRTAMPGSWKAARQRSNPKADWYVWADPQPDGTPPNNWLSVFGGSRLDAGSRGGGNTICTISSATSRQLNLHNPAVMDAALDGRRFWLRARRRRVPPRCARFHAARPGCEINPPRRHGPKRSRRNSFGLQQHVHDMLQPEAMGLLQRIRGLMDRYPGTVDAGRGIQPAGRIRAGRRLHKRRRTPAHGVHAARAARRASTGRRCGRCCMTLPHMRKAGCAGRSAIMTPNARSAGGTRVGARRRHRLSSPVC